MLTAEAAYFSTRVHRPEGLHCENTKMKPICHCQYVLFMN